MFKTTAARLSCQVSVSVQSRYSTTAMAGQYHEGVCSTIQLAVLALRANSLTADYITLSLAQLTGQGDLLVKLTFATI